MSEATLGTWALGVLGAILVAFITAMLTTRINRAHFEKELDPIAQRFQDKLTAAELHLGNRVARTEKELLDSETHMREQLREITTTARDHSIQLGVQETMLANIGTTIQDMKTMLQAAIEQKQVQSEAFIKDVIKEMRRNR